MKFKPIWYIVSLKLYNQQDTEDTVYSQRKLYSQQDDTEVIGYNGPFWPKLTQFWAIFMAPAMDAPRFFGAWGFFAPDSGAHFESFAKNFFLWAVFVTPNPNNPKLGKTILTSRVTHF